MTTVIVDAKNKVAYSDSRRTITEKGSAFYDSKGEKIFKHKSGKLLAAIAGDMGVALAELTRLGFMVNTKDCKLTRFMSEDSTSTLLLINKHNDHVLALNAKVNAIGKVRWERQYITEYNRCWIGSGSKVVTKCFNLDNGFPEERAIHCAAMWDKGTDDKVQVVKL